MSYSLIERFDNVIMNLKLCQTQIRQESKQYMEMDELVRQLQDKKHQIMNTKTPQYRSRRPWDNVRLSPSDFKSTVEDLHLPVNETSQTQLEPEPETLRRRLTRNAQQQTHQEYKQTEEKMDRNKKERYQSWCRSNVVNANLMSVVESLTAAIIQNYHDIDDNQKDMWKDNDFLWDTIFHYAFTSIQHYDKNQQECVITLVADKVAKFIRQHEQQNS
jgi:Asp-tRNA(Asn)/Glu-tRNA(Gln) amidotransferase A subunit family amidase